MSTPRTAAKVRKGREETVQAWTKAPPFIEAVAARKLHPSALPLAGDLRDEVVALLDGADVGPDDWGKAAFAFGKVFRWCAAVDLTRGRKTVLAEIGLRALAGAWVFDPAIFGDRPSLAELARRLEFSPANIAPHSAAFTRRFGVRNTYQQHAMNGEHSERIGQVGDEEQEGGNHDDQAM